MKEECKAWLTRFFEQRTDLSRPDGRELFRYRTTEEEFHQVECLLRNWLASFPPDDSLARLADDWLFCRLFVLYASEWWRRNYDGSGISWEPILSRLKINTGSWTQQQRSRCVQTGLKNWRVHVRKHGGYRFILSIALQGGLPLRLLSEGRGGLGKLLKPVLHLAGNAAADMQGNASVSEQDIYGWVESLQGMLPRSYRQPAIFILLSDIVVTVLELKHEATLTTSADAVDRLNRHVPGWRDRFSLPLEDDHAQGLIAQLLQDAAEVTLKKTSSPFLLERSLEKSEHDWRLSSTLQLPDAIETGMLTSFFTLPDEAILRHANLMLKAGEKKHTVALRRMAGHDKYRAMGQFPDMLDSDAVQDHVLDFNLADGRNWFSLVYRGEELDQELPWIFSAGADYRFLKQGSGKIAESEALVVIPNHWRMAIDEDNEELLKQGELSIFNRTIWHVRGQVTAINDRAEQFRFKTGRADATETSFIWKGDPVWYEFRNPTRAFRGQPDLYTVNSEGFLKPVKGSPDFQTLGSKGIDIPLGPIIGRYPSTGTPQCRTRMVLLPEKATVEINSHDSCSGSIFLKNWGVNHARTLTPGVQLLVEKQQPILMLHLCVIQSKIVPEQVELEVFWPISTEPARLSLPFPAKGARAFSITGEELQSGTRISVRQLLGTRIIIHSTAYNAHAELVLNSGTDNTSRGFSIRRADNALQMTVRLQDYEEAIRHTLSMDDQQDSQVSIKVVLDGSELFRLWVRRYEGYLAPDESRSFACLNDGMLRALDPQTLGGIRVLACNLIRENERVVTLTQSSSEGVPVGRWAFAAENPAPGPWFLFPHPDTPVTIRPLLMNVQGEVQGESLLTIAMNHGEYQHRQKTMSEAVHSLSEDYLHEGWSEVEQWAEQLGHLSLTAFDLWPCFARVSSHMAALAFRLGGVSRDFIRQFAVELPFSWETVTYRDWKQAMMNLRRQCEQRFEPAIWQTVFHSQLKSVTEKLADDSLALHYILGIASACFIESAKQDVVVLQYGVGPQAEKDLFTGDICLLQKLFHRHANDRWPGGFRQQLSDAKTHPVYSRYLCPDSYGFRDPVINLPLLLAAQCAVGETYEWFKDLDFIRILSICKAFDPDWFIDAYNLTIARCLADNVFQP